jgi:dihydrofolate reductase
MNSIRKYVASRSPLGRLEWNATALEGDLAESVSALKASTPGNLFSPGCGELAYSLVQAGLADEVLHWVHPLVLGADGERPFHGRGRVALELAASTAFDNGVVCQTYRPV